MAGKNNDRNLTSKLAGTFAAMAAAFLARKLITLAWTSTTGKEPPVHPEDPQVGLGEALGWAIITGVGVEAARLLATRVATRKLRPAGETKAAD